ncbi:MAG TPA: 3'(2'),5'-bisphosphate nucleotidase CysQ [Acidimicrobiales bacterium]|nr:3'(2'),5'-bisphosphate nucleotidase CysQ [Acidimicrobiales bacterium]
MLVDATDHLLAAELATAAGRILLDLRQRLAEGDSPAEVKDAGDAASHLWLTGQLAQRRPNDAVLSEEAAADPDRVNAARLWIIDPLDGTREFGEAGRTDWAVHVALVVGGEAVAGAVALPGMDLTLHTAEPPVVPDNGGRAPIVVVSRTRPPAAAQAVADALGGELLPMGSAGAKAMAVVRGEADVYVHTGGQYEWDSAAPVAVALAAGLHCSRVDGSPLEYGRESTWLPDLLIVRPELAEATLKAVAAYG